MPSGLKRFYGAGDLHFITCSCHQRKPWLDTPERRDLFLNLLDDARKKYRFVVLGYVVMPEHFHLLMSEPQIGDPSAAIGIVKQRFAQNVIPRTRQRGRNFEFKPSNSIPTWQPRFYDFNVWTEYKRIEKLNYMHRNPVNRGLVDSPEKWQWSSFRFYMYEEVGHVRVNDIDVMTLNNRNAA